jgi:hypothetical protein
LRPLGGTVAYRGKRADVPLSGAYPNVEADDDLRGRPTSRPMLEAGASVSDTTGKPPVVTGEVHGELVCALDAAPAAAEVWARLTPEQEQVLLSWLDHGRPRERRRRIKELVRQLPYMPGMTAPAAGSILGDVAAEGLLQMITGL